MRDPDVRTANLAVPGATLYYKAQGHGPLLLILQGGDGNADASDALAAGLTGGEKRWKPPTAPTGSPQP
jgi:hypothetical protein